MDNPFLKTTFEFSESSYNAFQNKKSNIEFEKLADYISEFFILDYLSSNFNKYHYFRGIAFP